MSRLPALVLAACSLIPLPAAAAAGDTVSVDDEIQAAVDRLHDEAAAFFHSGSHSISVIPLDDGVVRSAAGDVRHISLSAAKAIWIVVAVDTAGTEAVNPFAGRVFTYSSNSAASRVVSLVGRHPHEGVDAINLAMRRWGMEGSYMYGWFDHAGRDYGWHRSSDPDLPDDCCDGEWRGVNFVTTDDLAAFWAALAAGELLGPQETAQVLAWATLPRPRYNELLTNRLPADVAAEVADKSGWSDYRSRRIAGGVVTTPSGKRYALAISLKAPDPSELHGGGPDWARYASCEIYRVIEGVDLECTRPGDPASIRSHREPPATPVPVPRICPVWPE